MKIIFLFLILTSTAFAQTLDADKKWGIGGGAGWTLPLRDNNFNDEASDGFLYGVHARYLLSPENSVLLNFSHHNWGDTSIDASVFDLIYQFRTSPDNRWSPVWGVGAGLADVDSSEDSGTSFAAKLRGGVEYAVTDSLTASALVDLQYIPSDVVPGDEIYAVAPTINLTWFFNGPGGAGGIARAEQDDSSRIELDIDKDGIANAEDECPDTRSGVFVNELGCPVEGDTAAAPDTEETTVIIVSEGSEAGAEEIQAQEEQEEQEEQEATTGTDESAGPQAQAGAEETIEAEAQEAVDASADKAAETQAQEATDEATAAQDPEAIGQNEEAQAQEVTSEAAGQVTRAGDEEAVVIVGVPAQEQTETTWYDENANFFWIIVAAISLLGLIALAARNRNKKTRM